MRFVYTICHLTTEPYHAGVPKVVATDVDDHEAAIRASNQAFANMPAWMGIINSVRSLHTNNGGPIRNGIQQAVEAAEAGNCPDVAVRLPILLPM